MITTTNKAVRRTYTFGYNFELDSRPRYYAWSGWKYRAARVTDIQNNEQLPNTPNNHVFPEGDVVNYVDHDATRYTVQHEVHARATRLVSDPQIEVFKDLVAHNITVAANTGWDARGVSGLGVTLRQFGRGIASNEFHVIDPAGSRHASRSMAALQGVVKPHKQNCDRTHEYRAFEATTYGKVTSAAFMSRSVADSHGPGWIKAGLDLSRSTVAPGGVAIKMPKSSRYNEGTIIEYAPGCYSMFNRATKKFVFVINNKVVAVIGANGLE